MTTGYAKEILRNEYETYHTDKYEKLLKIVKEYSNSIVLINIDNAPGQFVLSGYLKSIQNLPDARSISIGIITHEKPGEKESAPKNCEYVFCAGKSRDRDLEKIIEFIEKRKAKGLRKQVRVVCADKDNIQITFTLHNKKYTGQVRDISSGALAVRFPEDAGPGNIKKKFDFILSLKKKKYRITAEECFVKPDNDCLIIFSDKLEEQAEDAIYDFIFLKLQERLDMEMAKSN
jgi:hypothetical protein